MESLDSVEHAVLELADEVREFIAQLTIGRLEGRCPRIRLRSKR